MPIGVANLGYARTVLASCVALHSDARIPLAPTALTAWNETRKIKHSQYNLILPRSLLPHILAQHSLLPEAPGVAKSGVSFFALGSKESRSQLLVKGSSTCIPPVSLLDRNNECPGKQLTPRFHHESCEG